VATRGETLHSNLPDSRFSHLGLLVLATAAIILAAIALRGTELYTSRYQSLPVLDWVESRPPVTETTETPTAADLARGLARTTPLLVIGDDVRPWAPVFGPPAVVQRSMGGVRDAARITLVSPDATTVADASVSARLYTIVFDRTLRAQEWSMLMGREMDIRDPDDASNEVHVSGPDETDGVWVVAPPQKGGIATVVGHRGPVGFDLQVTFAPSAVPPPTDATSEKVDLSARAEAAARQMASDYAAWLTEQLQLHGS
jgi:hypothetical protein